MNIVACPPRQTQQLLDIIGDRPHVILDCRPALTGLDQLTAAVLVTDQELLLALVSDVDIAVVDFVGAQRINMVFDNNRSLDHVSLCVTATQLKELISEKTIRQRRVL